MLFSVLKLAFRVSFKQGKPQTLGDQSMGVASGGDRLSGLGSVGKEGNPGRRGRQQPGRQCFEEAVVSEFI